MVILYPIPTVFSKHVLVPFNEKGMRLGQLLEHDPELRPRLWRNIRSYFRVWPFAY